MPLTLAHYSTVTELRHINPSANTLQVSQQACFCTVQQTVLARMLAYQVGVYVRFAHIAEIRHSWASKGQQVARQLQISLGRYLLLVHLP